MNRRTHIRKNPNETYCGNLIDGSIRWQHYVENNPAIQEQIVRLPEPLCEICKSLLDSELIKYYESENRD